VAIFLAPHSEMSEEMKAFLRGLSELLERHQAGITYTTADDGIHITIGEERVNIGFPDDGDTSGVIEAIK
jgi:hypothetical protein